MAVGKKGAGSNTDQLSMQDIRKFLSAAEKAQLGKLKEFVKKHGDGVFQHYQQREGHSLLGEVMRIGAPFESIKYLIGLGAAAGKEVDPIMLSINYSSLETCRKLIEEMEYPVVGRDAELACGVVLRTDDNKCMALLDYLLDQGLDLNKTDSQNKTAFHYLVDWYYSLSKINAEDLEYTYKTLEFLLENGADPKLGRSIDELETHNGQEHRRDQVEELIKKYQDHKPLPRILANAVGLRDSDEKKLAVSTLLREAPLNQINFTHVETWNHIDELRLRFDAQGEVITGDVLRTKQGPVNGFHAALAANKLDIAMELAQNSGQPVELKDLTQPVTPTSLRLLDVVGPNEAGQLFNPKLWMGRGGELRKVFAALSQPEKFQTTYQPCLAQVNRAQMLRGRKKIQLKGM